MKHLLSCILILNLTVSYSQTDINPITYSKQELSFLLDSIGHIDSNRWTKKMSNLVDSTLNNQTKLHHTLNGLDFETLKTVVQNGSIEIALAKQLFNATTFDSNTINNDRLPITYYSFDKNEKDYNEFAIIIGDSLLWDTTVYFFKSNTIIAKHRIFHRYGLEIKHFKSKYDNTIFYYTVNYLSGSGIWWNQFNFYSYNKDHIRPVLTEINNSNLQAPWGSRSYKIEATITNTNPLVFQFKYENQLTDTTNNTVAFNNDVTKVTYQYNTTDKKYVPNFTNTTLNRPKLLSYFITDNDLLFVNSNYQLFRKQLNSKNKLKQDAALNFLNALKNRLNTH
ncbi:hypothetical protein [Olleya sp. HaHaR_3_96]|uniref:hypothetical protein n=1 Tax=Olleya sp. HaHaR_3_96 TaxID=2745560 RepID=UPI001C4FF800|nr:hypothetical protein [Olleya sp. HaHaR_3_96]QXP60847.1 hypothetical protein H0I26_04200 [Olleya sp. HaHaR_3_96]